MPSHHLTAGTAEAELTTGTVIMLDEHRVETAATCDPGEAVLAPI
jgi:hypothetical protein